MPHNKNESTISEGVVANIHAVGMFIQPRAIPQIVMLPMPPIALEQPDYEVLNQRARNHLARFFQEQPAAAPFELQLNEHAQEVIQNFQALNPNA